MTRPTVVLTAAVPWDGTTARPQHFARGLARRGWPVLYVNGPVTWLAPLKNRDLWPRLWPRQPLLDIPVPALEDGSNQGWLRVLAPVASLPFGNVWRILNRCNQRLLAQQIRLAAPGPYVLLPMLPSSVDLVPYLHPVAVLYDCVDLHVGFRGWLRPATVEQMEADAAAVSRVVFATADTLATRMRRWHPDVRLLPNAAEVDHFATAHRVPVHPRLHSLPEPRVGLIGGLGPWVDWDFLAGLADALPHVQFVMIGPVETDVSALARRSNVHFLGLQPYAELPQYLAGLQATLVAFAPSELAHSVNPIKVYEYLAAGKEVVATSTHEIDKLAEFVWVVRTAAEGAAALQRILAGECRTEPQRRAAFVAQQSWDTRVQQLHEALLASLPAPLRG
ncbi:MAG: glycosyltransferase [Alicyclobacillus sp.]|nr:glycosyltransferase [Alicyclobacillus sp.]